MEVFSSCSFYSFKKYLYPGPFAKHQNKTMTVIKSLSLGNIPFCLIQTLKRNLIATTGPFFQK